MYCLTAAEARRAQKPFASTVSLSCPALTTRTCTWAAPGPTRWQLNCGASLPRSEEHTSELQSRLHLVCRLLLEKKKQNCINKTCLVSRRQRIGYKDEDFGETTRIMGYALSQQSMRRLQMLQQQRVASVHGYANQ